MKLILEKTWSKKSRGSVYLKLIYIRRTIKDKLRFTGTEVKLIHEKNLVTLSLYTCTGSAPFMRGLLFNAGYLESMLHLSYKVTESYARLCRNYKFFMNLKLHHLRLERPCQGCCWGSCLWKLQPRINCRLIIYCTITAAVWPKLWIEKTNVLVDIETGISRNLKGLGAIENANALVSPGSRPRFGFPRPNPAENESPIANR